MTRICDELFRFNTRRAAEEQKVAIMKAAKRPMHLKRKTLIIILTNASDNSKTTLKITHKTVN